MWQTVITSSVLILGLLLLRRVFSDKIPAGLGYFLWIIVAVRLVLPLPQSVYQALTKDGLKGIESPVSVMNVANRVTKDASGIMGDFSFHPDGGGATDDGEKNSEKEKGKNTEEGSAAKNGAETKGSTANGTEEKSGTNDGMAVAGNREQAVPETGSGTNDIPVAGNSDKKNLLPADSAKKTSKDAKKGAKPGYVSFPASQPSLKTIWYAGMLLMFFWQVAVMARFRIFLKKHRRKILSGDMEIYSVKGLASPCVARGNGLRPVIYVPEEITGDSVMMEHAVAHEAMHLRHGDLWWACLRNILVAIYWFHPLVWLAARVSVNDCELFCDDGVIRNMSSSQRKEYGQNLIRLLENRTKSQKLFYMTPAMGGSKKQMKERLHRIAGKKTEGKFYAVTALVLAAVLTGCTFTDAVSGKKENTADEEFDEEAFVEGLMMKKMMSIHVLVRLYYNEGLEGMSYNDYMEYDNCVRRVEVLDGEEDSAAWKSHLVFELKNEDEPCRVIIGLSDDYKSHMDSKESVSSVTIVNEDTNETGILYSSDEDMMRHAVSLKDFLNHDYLLDGYISYELPEGLENGKCRYYTACSGTDGDTGRLFLARKDYKNGVYGGARTPVWSGAGGIMRESLDVDWKTNLPVCSWGNYQDNGEAAAKGEAVTILKNGEREEISGCEAKASIEGIEIGKNAVGTEEPVWYQMPAGDKKAEPPRSLKELLPMRIWVVCMQKEGEEKGYILYLNADRFAKKDAVALARTVHFEELYENDYGVKATKEEYEQIILSSYPGNPLAFNIRTRESLEEYLCDTVLSGIFHYENDLEQISEEDIVKEEGFRWCEAEDGMEPKMVLDAVHGFVIKMNRNDAVARAKRETDIAYTLVRAAHDYDNQMWRISFSDGDKYGADGALRDDVTCQYVYIGMDGLTRKVVTTNRWLD